MAGRHNASDSRSESSTPRSETSIERNTSISTTSQPLQWINYSAQPPDSHKAQDADAYACGTFSNEPYFDNRMSAIPDVVQPDLEQASICFFFRYYSGTILDPRANKSLTTTWQPMYLRSSANSPLRIATSAVAVNVAMMWSFKGCDTRPARNLYAKAISATRKALTTPSRSTIDELLMTTLIFDLYECLQSHYVPGLPHPLRHKQGALALLRLKGATNYTTESSRELVLTTRHDILQYAITRREPLPPGAEEYFDHPSVMNSTVKQLDKLAIMLVHVQCRLDDLKQQSSSGDDCGERRRRYTEVVVEAMKINDLMGAWKQSVTNPEWMAQYVLREEVLPTIVAAGFYGARCAVWADLAYPDMWNLYHKLRLLTLQVIRQAYADEPSLGESPGSASILENTNSTMQALADAICETVPFHLGDTVVPTNPIYSKEINFPYKVITDPETGRTTSIPSMETVYRSRAAASGGWNIFTYLLVLYRLAEPEDGALPLVLRDGQLDWIKGQIKRLQTTFLFCDPVWFKRLPPRHLIGGDNTLALDQTKVEPC
ncbi:hypothetical protein A1O1_04354 [Capronia coronata CBS 617.96]|uniref:Transcription factor domain-containing protein n=1 Tax=Capronia coronata CBS 617.96 TaxID=1182541 RepID=W9Z9P5_9EURO|nr:uncharacterized protein A1O1_04354 [Capronia coronata CBS 617.96]EXJ91244.1 hypothetical protein A1O1_04354 [Capronia coronata CBS 617.96]